MLDAGAGAAASAPEMLIPSLFARAKDVPGGRDAHGIQADGGIAVPSSPIPTARLAEGGTTPGALVSSSYEPPGNSQIYFEIVGVVLPSIPKELAGFGGEVRATWGSLALNV